MNYFAPRTCTEILEAGSNDRPQYAESRPLEDFREKSAYVLLGAPGAGKTEAFKQEADAPEDCVTARNFLTLDEWSGRNGAPLFIDALDERRAGLSDGLTPLDRIRKKLIQLDRPRFRLSCREADWFGANDRTHLKAVSPDDDISVIRLDPLPQEEVSRVLRKNLGIPDPAAFIASAKEQGIGELLSNPQMLRMLVEAVNQSGEQAFPRSRTETFDLACRQLLSEHSDEHRLARDKSFGMDALMDAAGRLCSVQLLTGGQGYRLPGGASEPDFPDLDDIAAEDIERLRQVVSTKLFHTPSEGHVAPFHRQVAEFLAARYLAGLISNGLPLRRILSLMTGYDSVIVSELRGLSAWLAAHSRSGRAEIMARDPVGALLYGDVRDWSVPDKVLLLEHLNRESKKNPWSVGAIKSEARFGDISTQDMAGEIRNRLENPERDDAWQSFISIVVEMLRYGDPLPGAAKVLLDVVRDGSRWPRIRHSAIKAFTRQRGARAGVFAELRELLDEVYAGRVSDSDAQLLGWLLKELYPKALAPSELLQYLRVPKESNNLTLYEYFWNHVVPNRSTTEQLVQLLDMLTDDYEATGPLRRPMRRPIIFVRRLPGVWLRHVLTNCTEEIDPYRLFHWLGAAARVGDWDDDGGIVSDPARTIRSWLEEHPELCKWLLDQGLKRCIELEECDDLTEFGKCMYMQKDRRLFRARMSKDYGRWCLDKALVTEDSNAQMWLIREVVICLKNHRDDEGISLESITRLLGRIPSLKTMFDECWQQTHQFDAWNTNFSREQEIERKQSQKKERKHLKPHETALRDNRAEPGLLYNLALVYLGANPHFRSEDPKSRLFNLLGNDHDLVEAVLQGLRGSIDRTDTPNVDEVIKLSCESKRHILAVPMVAGLEERAKAAPDHQVTLDDDKLRLALAIHYTEPHWSFYIGGGRPAEQKSLWFPPVLRSYPQIVSEVLTKLAGAKLRNGADSVDGLYELAHSQDQREVAQLAAFRLLEVFPVRCRVAQLQDLRHLLHSAALNIRDALPNLIERKLANSSMNSGQRVYWMAAGLLISPDQYAEELDAYVAVGKRRIQNLERFFGVLLDLPPGLFELLDVSALKLLIRRVGANRDNDPAVWRSNTGEGGLVTQGMGASLRVRDFIHQLASKASEAATTVLRELSLDDSLTAWRSQLLNAADQQERTRREGHFQHCSLEQALAVLRNQKPANAADLAALVTDQLIEIASNIRDGPTSDWRQYWHLGSYDRPRKPRSEDVCRDALLSDLRHKLSLLGFHAHPEVRYADDKRADIGIICNGLNVPVEIKKSCHRDLWSAIENQLVAKYARDPHADGYGIYVVFWFGNTEHCRPTPGTAGVPRSAEELERRLRESLSEEIRRKISVCVIDVVKPPA